jgi:hypothetical protein
MNRMPHKMIVFVLFLMAPIGCARSGLESPGPQTPDERTCNMDSECPDGQICHDHVCVVDVRECNDDRPCPAGEHCENGTCVIDVLCNSDADCSDGLFCNGIEVCDSASGCMAGEPPLLDDGFECTQDACDEERDLVIHLPEDSVCDDGNECTTSRCLVTDGCVDTFDDAIVPQQLEVSDCQKEVCQNGIRVSIQDDTDLPSQDSNGDCIQQTCQNGVLVTVADDFEVPAQLHSGDCQKEICQDGFTVSVPDNNESPAQSSDQDCVTEICLNGDVVAMPANGEIPPAGGDNDCVREICQGGAIQTIPDDSETPPADEAANCKQNVCADGVISPVADHADLPNQISTQDCLRETCVGGAIISIADNSETPPADGSECRVGLCEGGEVQINGNDEACDDGTLCTAGTCETDGSCAFTPQDSLCPPCPNQNSVAQCEPANPIADTNGCLCLTPAVLTCNATPETQQVLEPISLVALAPDAAAGSTFLWELVGTPVGVDPSAQLISDSTTANAVFTPTAPSADVNDTYTLQVTLQEPQLAPQTCLVNVVAEALPDTFEISLFLADSLDVDLHVIGGTRSNPEDLKYDMPFHPLHVSNRICDDSCFYAGDGVCDDGGADSSYSVCDLGSDCSDCGTRQISGPGVDDPNRDCYFANCNVCSVEIPDQPSCTAIDPRVVDFDNPADGAAINDTQDPQLDIDNRRGCYQNASLEPVCIPEKVTVEEPSPGIYFVWAYLYGNAMEPNTGILTSPMATTVEIEVKCRGESQRYSRLLSSEDILNPNTASAASSYERIGGSNGFIRFEIPAGASSPCSLPAP